MKPVVVIGAGPAGLTAAFELRKSGRQVVVLEATSDIGGISKTVNHAGNRIDIGGHRFFSKSDWVMDWWRDILPVALPDGAQQDYLLGYQGANRLLGSHLCVQGEGRNDIMLLRNRLSRIYYAGEFFDYPLKANFDTARKLGMGTCMRFGSSYAWSRVNQIRPEVTLEDFFINRFGTQLYRRFFKEYTEKVWGVSCEEISAEWGAQRIKSLSVMSALKHAALRAIGRGGSQEQTSLIEHFLYPKYGPGQMWETVADKLRALGTDLRLRAPVVRIDRNGDEVAAVVYRDEQGQDVRLQASHVVSTMPIKDLVGAITPAPDLEVAQISRDLQYRDFITVGVLYRKLLPTRGAINSRTHLVPDNWIYIQEPGVKVGRLQIFNNWSPYMVRDPETVWVGLEFFASEHDSLWAMRDDELKSLAVKEMRQLRLALPEDALDSIVIRMPKAYPGYYGQAYDRLPRVRNYLDGIRNLFLVGRNGMHRYNNQDHSMLSARFAAEAIVAGSTDKAAIWAVNIDDDYHEQTSSSDAPQTTATPLTVRGASV